MRKRKLRKRIRKLKKRIRNLEHQLAWQPTTPPAPPNIGAEPDWTPETEWRQLCDEYIIPTEWVDDEDLWHHRPGPNGYL